MTKFKKPISAAAFSADIGSGESMLYADIPKSQITTGEFRLSTTELYIDRGG